MKRDNFPSAIILKLRDRVNNFCSYPTCKISTRSAHSSPDKSKSTGIAAHICAAAKNGPRYDSNMSMAERKDISNAIWLCSNCATIIDKDPDSYPIALLKKWKHDAENRISENHGQPFLTQEEYLERFKKDLISRKEELIAIMHSSVAPSAESSAKLRGIEEKLQNVEASYEQELDLRRDIENTLANLKSSLPEEVLKHAQDKLADGNTDKAQELLEKIIDDGESNLIQAYFTNGQILENKFEYSQAFIMYERAALLSKYEPLIVSFAAKLAYTLGRFDDALNFLDNGIESLDQNSNEAVIFLNQQGLILRAIAEYSKAIQKFKTALDTLEYLASDESSELVQTVKSNLGLVYVDQGAYPLARSVYDDLVKIEVGLYGENSVKVCTSLMMLGTICEKERKIEDAEVFYRTAYEIYAKEYGDEHPETITPLNNLAMIYVGSNPKLAETMLKKALRLRLKYYGEIHYKTATVLNNLASCYKAQNNPLKAINFFSRALTSTLASFGEDHPEALRIKHNMALSMNEAGQEPRALELMREVANKRVGVLGAEHPLTKLSLDCLRQLEISANPEKHLEGLLSALMQAHHKQQNKPS